MIKGLYNSAMGMLVQEASLNTSSNNLANVSTVGYKKDRVTFEEFPNTEELRLNDTKLKPGRKFYEGPVIGRMGTGVILDRVTTNHDSGTLRETGNRTEMALDGKAYFMVQTPEGIRYSKDGRFHFSQDGYLVNRHGHKVMGLEGSLEPNSPVTDKEGKLAPYYKPILVEDELDFQVNETGAVVGAGIEVLKVVFDNTNNLQKDGKTLYRLTDGKAIYSHKPILRQGFVETSNVNVVHEMVNMIKISRAYEANSKILTGIDERLGQTVREVGSLR